MSPKWRAALKTPVESIELQPQEAEKRPPAAAQKRRRQPRKSRRRLKRADQAAIANSHASIAAIGEPAVPLAALTIAV
jgi:hypothetical protein